MELSIFLAKVWGLYLLIMMVSLLLNKGSLKRLFKLVKDENFLFVSGFISLLIGVLSVVAHNIWSFDWVGLVTLFGWLALIKGIVRFTRPDYTISIANKLEKNYTLIYSLYVVMLIVGAYLTYVGFTA